MKNKPVLFLQNKKFEKVKSIKHIFISSIIIAAVALFNTVPGNSVYSMWSSYSYQHCKITANEFLRRIESLHGKLEESLILNLIKENELDLNSTTKYGESILHIAAKYGNCEILQALKDKIVSWYSKTGKFTEELFKTNNSGCTVIYYSIFNKDPEVLNFLLNAISQDTGWLTIINKFQANARLKEIVNKRSNHGYSPLTLALMRNNTVAMDILIKAGANPNERYVHKNRSMLHLAAKQGNTDAIQVLTNNNANINITDDYGQTPLHLAVEQGNVDAIQVLIEKGAIIDTKNNEGCTPLRCATENGDNSVVQILINNGATINKKYN